MTLCRCFKTMYIWKLSIFLTIVILLFQDNLLFEVVYTAISIKVSPEQSGKVEYEREMLLGWIANKLINLLAIPKPFALIRHSTSPLCSGDNLNWNSCMYVCMLMNRFCNVCAFFSYFGVENEAFFPQILNLISMLRMPGNLVFAGFKFQTFSGGTWPRNSYVHRKKRPACNNAVENRPEQYFAAHIELFQVVNNIVQLFSCSAEQYC
jgi:hypothetical protein